jgi:hypothetical protein
LSEIGHGRSSKLLSKNSEGRETRSLLGVIPKDVGFIFRIIMVSKADKCLFCVSGSMNLSGRGIYKGQISHGSCQHNLSLFISVYNIFLFATRMSSLRLALAPVSLALCIQWSRVETGSFTSTFKVQQNNKGYIFIILVTVLVCHVDYLTKLYQF